MGEKEQESVSVSDDRSFEARYQRQKLRDSEMKRKIEVIDEEGRVRKLEEDLKRLELAEEER